MCGSHQCYTQFVGGHNKFRDLVLRTSHDGMAGPLCVKKTLFKGGCNCILQNMSNFSVNWYTNQQIKPAPHCTPLQWWWNHLNICFLTVLVLLQGIRLVINIYRQKCARVLAILLCSHCAPYRPSQCWRHWLPLLVLLVSREWYRLTREVISCLAFRRF